MQFGVAVSLLLLNTASWCQIDTRISPPPAVQTEGTPVPKWSGAPPRGFLSETIGSSLREGVEATIAISESANNEYPNAAAIGYRFDEVSRVTGTMSVHHEWSRASLLMQYAAGTDRYVKNSYLDDQFHEVQLTEALKLSRWNLSLAQHFDYLPESSFGFNPAHVLGSGVAPTNEPVSSLGVDFFLPPSVVQRTIGNNVSAEYLLGGRSSISLNGSFTDLHFGGTAPGVLLIDSQTLVAGAKYGLAVSRANTIGGTYEYEQGHALGLSSLMHTHSVAAMYEHRIGSRLTFAVAAGPQFTTLIQNGIQTDVTTSATLTASAIYEAGRFAFRASYLRGTNPGSGFFVGSRDNSIQGSITRQFGRALQASCSIGNTHNHRLGTVSLNSAEQINSTYFTFSVERSFGRLLSAFVSYRFADQDSNTPLCNSAGCVPFNISHSGTAGVRFHIHPLTLQP